MTVLEKVNLKEVEAQEMKALQKRVADQRPRFDTITAEELQTKDFPELAFVVDQLIVPGLTFLVGAPKGGKSWAAMNICFGVSTGSKAFGNLQCAHGDALYLALEDNQRRLKSRLHKLNPYDTWPPKLRFVTESPRLNDGGLAMMETWFQEADNPTLIVVDVFVKVRDASTSSANGYDADYASVVPLQKFASENSIAILCIHHTRKMKADDALETVSGTTGLTGAADTILILQRDTTLSKGEAILKGRGRDIPDVEMALTFNEATCEWQHLGDASEYRASKEEQEIIDALMTSDQAMGAQEIVEILPDLTTKAISQRLARMAERGKIRKTGYGKYRPLDPVEPVEVSNLGGVE